MFDSLFQQAAALFQSAPQVVEQSAAAATPLVEKATHPEVTHTVDPTLKAAGLVGGAIIAASLLVIAIKK